MPDELPKAKHIDSYEPDRVEDLIAKYLVPVLDRDTWREQDELDSNHVKHTSYLLARVYRENANSFILSVARWSVVWLILDFLFFFPAQGYGLAFDIYGAWLLLVYGPLRGRFAIAKQSKTSVGYNSAQRRDLARTTVFSNLGLIWLTTGFSLQILALTFLQGPELIDYNLWPHLIDLFTKLI